MSFPDSLRALVEDIIGAVVGFSLAAAIVLVPTPLVARARPADRRAWTTRRTARACTRSPSRASAGWRSSPGSSCPCAIFIDLDGRLPRDPHRDAAGRRARPRRRHPRHHAEREAGRDRADRADPGRGLRRALRPRRRCPVIGDHDLGWAAYPLTILWIAVPRQPRQPDRRDGRAGRGHRRHRRGLRSRSWPSSFGRIDAAVAAAIVCGATLAFLARNYHPAKIFMGDSGALALGLPARHARRAGRAEDRGRDRAGRAAARARHADPRHVLRRAQAAQVPAAPWGADHNHFYHRFMRIGFSQRRTAAYLHVWAALARRLRAPRCASCRRARTALGPRQHALDLASGLSCSPRSVWMVYSLEILKARHLRSRGCGASPRRITRRSSGESEAVERIRLGGGTGRDRAGEREPQQLGGVAADAVLASALGRLRARRSSSPGVAQDPQPALARRAARPRAPSCPSNIDHTGVPSTAASRFIVPPAETSRSASATRLRPSTARSGTISARGRAPRRRVAARSVRGEHDRLRALGAQPLQHAGQQRALAAAEVERVGRARCGRPRAAARRSTPSCSQHGGSGSKSAR